jgi:riboflavin kinase/FMN adenylyltransferase
MKAEEELARSRSDGGSVVTIGTFDGVHWGHQLLIQRVKEEARRRGLLSAVVTFDKIPRTVINPDLRVSRLTPLPERLRLLASLEVDQVVPLTFDTELSRLTAQEFVTLLIRYLGMRHLVTGPGFALGRGRGGTSEVLTQIGQELGYTVQVLEPFLQDGERVSSTAVRQALAEGRMERVMACLGRPFGLVGRVVVGRHRGKGLGFPTANLALEDGQALPPDGVYVTRARLEGQPLPSVTNVGDNPTFGDVQRWVEVHILDFDRDIYGRELRIDLLHRLREEVRFPTVEALVEQMHRDVAAARAFLAASDA